MVEAMEELVRMRIVRAVIHYRDPESATVKWLIQQGFIESTGTGDGMMQGYKLTQRGVDEANRFAEGKKTFIGEDQ